MDNRCIACGFLIPEGRQICEECECTHGKKETIKKAALADEGTVCKSQGEDNKEFENMGILTQNDTVVKSVYQILSEVCEGVCDDLCRWPGIYLDIYHDSDLAYEHMSEEKCETCPLCWLV